MRARTPRVRIRPFAPGDERAVDVVFAGLSASSRQLRYHTPIEEMSGPVLASLRAVDGERHVALIAEVGRGRWRRAIGLARYLVDAPGRAEVAYEVVDDWQGRGVGSRLVGALVAAARANGLDELHAEVLPGNGASLAVLRRHLPTLRVARTGGVLHVSAELRSSPLGAEDILADLEVA